MEKHSQYIANEKCKAQNSTRVGYHIKEKVFVYIHEKYKKNIHQILVVVIFGWLL